MAAQLDGEYQLCEAVWATVQLIFAGGLEFLEEFNLCGKKGSASVGGLEDYLVKQAVGLLEEAALAPCIANLQELARCLKVELLEEGWGVGAQGGIGELEGANQRAQLLLEVIGV